MIKISDILYKNIGILQKVIFIFEIKSLTTFAVSVIQKIGPDGPGLI